MYSSKGEGLGFRSSRNIVEGVLSREKRGKPRTFRLHRAAPATVRCEFESQIRGLGSLGWVPKGGLAIFDYLEPSEH